MRVSERDSKRARTPFGLALFGILGALALAALIALAGSQGSVEVAGVPLFALCVASALLMQWVAFIPAYLRQTESFYDLTGSVTFITLAALSLLLAELISPRSILIVVLTLLWASRLGIFLTSRLRSVGFDRRFRSIKPNFALFLMTWTLQGLWVTLSLAPGLAAISASEQPPVDVFLVAGAILWLIGFAIEVIADDQKRKFRLEQGNKGRFINTGLWAWSQHPNYFGEIVLWTGVAVIAYPSLQGWQHLTLISPIFVWLLLTRISGVRMLDASAKRRWGDDSAYAAYIAATPKLIPRPPRRCADSLA